MLMNGVEADWPASCLSIFSLVNISAVSTACHRSSMGNRTRYNFVGSMLFNNSRSCVATYPVHITYESNVSVFFHQNEMITMHEITVLSCFLFLDTVVWIDFVSIDNLHL